MKMKRLLVWVFMTALFLVAAVKADEPVCELYYDGADFGTFCELGTRPEVNAYSAFVINRETGSVIYAKNENDPVYPASAVKLMTAIVAYENIPDMTTEITASAAAVRAARGANSNIRADEVFTAEQLFYMLLVTGSNDAANVLAEYVGGSIENFVGMMNEKAAEIGAGATHFTNPTGMHEEDMITSARDIARIASCFYGYTPLLEMSDMPRYTVPKTNRTDTVRTLLNRNFLISKVRKDEFYDSRAAGMSLGNTDEAGECLVTSTHDDTGLSYIIVLMNAPLVTDNASVACAEATKLIDHCLHDFSKSTVLSPKNIICEIPVELSTQTDYVTLFPETDVKALLPSDLDMANDITFEPRVSAESLQAPIKEGEVLGEVLVKYRDTLSLGSVPLVAGKDVKRSRLLAFLNGAEQFVGGTWFRVFIITTLVLLALYFGLSVYYTHYSSSGKRGRRP